MSKAGRWVGQAQGVPADERGAWGVQVRLCQTGRQNVQPVDSGMGGEIDQQRPGAAAHFEQAMGAGQPGLCEEISAQIVRPSGLLEESGMPIHAFIIIPAV